MIEHTRAISGAFADLVAIAAIEALSLLLFMSVALGVWFDVKLSRSDLKTLSCQRSISSTKFHRGGTRGFQDLPKDVQDTVVSFLDIVSLTKLECTSSRTRTMLKTSITATRTWATTCDVNVFLTQSFGKVAFGNCSYVETKRKAYERLEKWSYAELAYLQKYRAILESITNPATRDKAFVPGQLVFFKDLDIARAASSKARNIVLLESDGVALILKRNGIDRYGHSFLSFNTAESYGKLNCHPTSLERSKGFIGFFWKLAEMRPGFEEYRLALITVFGLASLWDTEEHIRDAELNGENVENAISLETVRASKGDYPIEVVPWKRCRESFQYAAQVSMEINRLTNFHNSILQSNLTMP